MKAGWEVRPLGEFTVVVTKGTTPTSVGFKFSDSGVNFVKIEAISLDGKIKHEKLAKISLEAHAALGRSQLQEGDVLFSIAGALGRIAIVDSSLLPANTNQALSIIRLKPEAPIDRSYLAYCLSSSAMNEQISQQQGGVAQQNLSLAQVKGFQIPIPPLEEQKQIVAVLDAAFEGLTRAKENAEANLQNARELFESSLDKAFSSFDKTMPLAQLCEIRPNKKLSKEGLLGNDLVSFVPMDCLPILEKQFSEKEARELDKVYGSYTYFADDDVLVAKITPCFENGKMGLAQGLTNGVGFGSSEFVVLRSYGEIDPEFLFYFLRRPDFRKFGARVMSGAVGHRRVPKEYFEELEVPVCSRSAQKEICLKLSMLSQKCAQAESQFEKAIADVADLRQSLLQKAFAGELT